MRPTSSSSKLATALLFATAAALASVACGSSESPADDSGPTSDDFTAVNAIDTPPEMTRQFIPAFSPGVLRAKLPKTLQKCDPSRGFCPTSVFVGGAGLQGRCDLVRTDAYRTNDLVIAVGENYLIDAAAFRFFRQTDGRAGVRVPIRSADPNKRIPLTLYCVSGNADLPTAAMVELALSGAPQHGFTFMSSRPAAPASDAGTDAAR